MPELRLKLKKIIARINHLFTWVILVSPAAKPLCNLVFMKSYVASEMSCGGTSNVM